MLDILGNRIDRLGRQPEGFAYSRTAERGRYAIVSA